MVQPTRRGGVVVCTIIARNYLGYARVLAESTTRHNPSVRFVTLVIDAEAEESFGCDIGEVFRLGDLDMAPETLESMLVMYTVVELATALKPFLLAALLAQGHSVVTYLDPDVEVYADLDDVFAAARRSAVALTPHVLTPLPRDGREVSERTIMLAGMFNLGFIAVASGSEPFLGWWQERLRTEAVVDFENGLFTDQRWVDWAPAFLDVAILRDPGLNVAYWNTHERVLSTDGAGRVLVNGGVLRFFHFSGFDPTTPWLLSRFTGEEPRVLLSESPTLAGLCADHATALTAADDTAAPYRFDALPGGPNLTHEVRRVYRNALLGRSPFGKPPPRPFSEPGAFREWLGTPTPSVPFGRLAPADLAVWAGSADLRRNFPSVLGAASVAYTRWLDSAPDLSARYREIGLGPPGAQRAEGGAGRLASGWAVVPTGAPEPSETVRHLAVLVGSAVGRAGVAWSVVEPPRSSVSGVEWRRRGTAPPDTWLENVVVCIDTEHFSEDRVVEALAYRNGARVALWFAPEGELPLGAEHVAPLFDEHWLLRGSATALVERLGGSVLRWVGFPLDAGPTAEVPQWMAAQVQAGPTFLVPIDVSASPSRCSPDHAVRAFEEAFGPGVARLVILVAGGPTTRRQGEVLRRLAGRTGDVVVVEAALDDPGLRSAVTASAGVIVLQTDPGLDAVAAVALAAGVPVVTSKIGAAAGAGAHCVPMRPDAAGRERPDVVVAAGVLRRLAAGRPRGTSQDERAEAASIISGHVRRLTLDMPHVARRTAQGGRRR